ncbi:MAG TPA: hypothetical protein VFQ16_13390 [Burkholderiaceae bacterium]|nr:hypothetical protein [Burkholderiaceae bacterium]
MNAVHWIWIASALLAGAALGAASCHWFLRRTITRLNDRLVRSEQARAGAIERSTQAREQVAKLNQAIDELRKQLTRRSAEDERRERTARAEESLKQASAEDKTIILPRHSTLQAFADTQTLER